VPNDEADLCQRAADLFEHRLLGLRVVRRRFGPYEVLEERRHGALLPAQML
jgi:hypothetical protein